MPRTALAVALAATLLGLESSAQAQEKQPPGSDVAATHSSTPGVPSFPDMPQGDPRSNVFAPARVPIHAGAKVGDWLEHVRTRKHPQGVIRDRTTIAGRVGDLWVVDRTGPMWIGRALRLICATDGRVVAAAAGKPGEEELAAVKIRPEPVQLESTPIDLDTPIGKIKARRERVQLGNDPDAVTTRIVGAEGAFEGVFLGRELDHDGRKSGEHIVGLEEAKLAFAGSERPCFKLTLENTVNGAPKGPRVEVWLSKTPLFFGEHALQQRDSNVEETIEQGAGGTPAFPLTH